MPSKMAVGIYACDREGRRHSVLLGPLRGSDVWCPGEETKGYAGK